MVNPSPVPLILVALVALKKRENKCFCSSGGMPIPSSLIEIISFREQSLRSLDKQSTEQLKNVLSYSGKECDRYSSLVNLLDEL